jgi:hypothetical protein
MSSLNRQVSIRPDWHDREEVEGKMEGTRGSFVCDIAGLGNCRPSSPRGLVTTHELAMALLYAVPGTVPLLAGRDARG